MPSGVRIGESVTPLSGFCIAYSQENSVRWIVWLGRYALDKHATAPIYGVGAWSMETRAPNAQLIPVRNRK